MNRKQVRKLIRTKYGKLSNAARAHGIPANYLYKWVMGLRRIPPETAIEIARNLVTRSDNTEKFDAILKCLCRVNDED